MKIKGKATNPTSEPVFNADVYGLVKDQANDDVLNSGRVGSIDKLEPGERLRAADHRRGLAAAAVEAEELQGAGGDAVAQRAAQPVRRLHRIRRVRAQR